MGTDDSVYTSKRGIASISRSFMSARAAPPMRANMATKFFLLLAIVTFLVYVLAERGSPEHQAVPTHQIRSAGPASESVKLSAPPQKAAGIGGESEKANDEAEISDKHRRWVERNIEKMCNHTVVGWGDKEVMHDILTYISILDKPITYLDVGANVGSTSVPAFKCFKTKHRVIAIEPVKVNYESIVSSKESTSLTPVPEDRFLAANVGFSDETKKTRMWIPGRRGDNAALSEKASTTVFKDGLRQEEVQVYRGDEFLKMHNAEPKLIKIDVQGSEIRVLRGMEEYLKRHKGMLIMAEHDDRLIKNSGFGINDVYDFMKNVGFKIYYKPDVRVKNGEFFVDSEEVDRENLIKIRGDLVFWKSGA